MRQFFSAATSRPRQYVNHPTLIAPATVSPEPPHTHGKRPSPGCCWCKSGHARRPHRVGGASLPTQIPQRCARGEIPRPAVAADPAIIPVSATASRPTKCKTSGDPRGLTAEGVDRKPGQLLRGWLGQRNHPCHRTARQPRYGSPAIPPSWLDALKAQGYPHPGAARHPQWQHHHASVSDAVYAWANAPAPYLSCAFFVSRYHDDPTLFALAASVAAPLAKHGEPNSWLMSFHGVPEAHAGWGDPTTAIPQRPRGYWPKAGC